MLGQGIIDCEVLSSVLSFSRDLSYYLAVVRLAFMVTAKQWRGPQIMSSWRSAAVFCLSLSLLHMIMQAALVSFCLIPSVSLCLPL